MGECATRRLQARWESVCVCVCVCVGVCVCVWLLLEWALDLLAWACPSGPLKTLAWACVVGVTEELAVQMWASVFVLQMVKGVV